MFNLYNSSFLSGSIMARSKIGLYWGTFDPPTVTHFNIMKNAITQGNLDKLVIVINDNTGPKHYHTPGKNRAAMIRKMFWDSDKQQPIALMKQTPIEIIVQTDNYKIDSQLIEKMNGNTCIVPIVGQDSFITSTKYCKNHEEVIVAPRGENEADQLTKAIAEHQLNNIRILELGNEFLTVSSTLVRSKVCNMPNDEEPQIASLVTPSTANYIRSHYFFKDGYHAEHHDAALTLQKAWRKFVRLKTQEPPPENENPTNNNSSVF